jgi:hypothetical protein
MRNNVPRHSLDFSVAGELCPVSYNDLIELARLCLLRANATRTPAAANELRRMAKEYQARADAMLKEQRLGTADGALGRPALEAPSRSVQQQQQPQESRTDASSARGRPMAARPHSNAWATPARAGRGAARVDEGERLARWRHGRRSRQPSSRRARAAGKRRDVIETAPAVGSTAAISLA